MRKEFLKFMLVIATFSLFFYAMVSLVPEKGIPISWVGHAQFPSNFNSCENSRTTTTLTGATSGTAAVQLVALNAAVPIYVCSMEVVGASGTTPTFSLVYGSGANCATGQTVFVPAVATVANAPVALGGRYLGAVPAGKALCYLDGGTTPVQNYIIVYAQG